MKESKAKAFIAKYMKWLHPSAEIYQDVLRELGCIHGHPKGYGCDNRCKPSEAEER